MLFTVETTRGSLFFRDTFHRFLIFQRNEHNSQSFPFSFNHPLFLFSSQTHCHIWVCVPLLTLLASKFRYPSHNFSAFTDNLLGKSFAAFCMMGFFDCICFNLWYYFWSIALWFMKARNFILVWCVIGCVTFASK